MDRVKLSHVHSGLTHITHSNGDMCAVPAKAYRNVAWLNSNGAKWIRILAEFQEPEQRMAAANVRNTILFFGSARSRETSDHAVAMTRTAALLEKPDLTPAERKKYEAAMSTLKRTAWMCPVYDQIAELSRRLTQWSMDRIPETPDLSMPYCVITGGGPGFMEAANKGAASVPGALTAGCAISLPFENGLNKYVTPELGWMQHYFFTRKYLLCNRARALIVAPGGYGTLDELMEVLTLAQTGKIDQGEMLPVVLFGEKYWKSVINFQALVDSGVIAPGDVDRLFFTDSVEDAYLHVIQGLLKWEKEAAEVTAEAALHSANAKLSAAATAHAAALQALREAEAAKAAAAAEVSVAMGKLNLPSSAGEMGAVAAAGTPAIDGTQSDSTNLISPASGASRVVSPSIDTVGDDTLSSKVGLSGKIKMPHVQRELSQE